MIWKSSGVAVALAVCAALVAPAWSQESPVSAPPPGEPAANPIPDLSTDHTTVLITPDPSATSMADPQSAAEYGSPSAVESPSSPMPDPSGWPALKAGAKRPKWVKKAPPSEAPPPPAPH